MIKTTIYVDGSYLAHKQCGGFAAIPLDEDGTILIEHSVCGAQKSNGCQEMELVAVIEGIKSVPKTHEVTIFTDHKTICDVLAKPTRSRCESGINRNLWNQLRQLCQTRQVQLKWVKAHFDSMANIEADRLAYSKAISFVSL